MKKEPLKRKVGRQRQPKVWEKPIPKSQRRKLNICPKCNKRFFYWQYASKHAEENKHYGDYNIYPDRC